MNSCIYEGVVLHRRRVGVELDDLLDDDSLEDAPKNSDAEKSAGIDVRDLPNLEASTSQTDNAEPASAQS